MEKDFVTFDQGKLLKDKGFNVITDARFFFNSELTTETQSQSSKPTIPAPQQHEVVKWLLKNHGIWVEASVLQVFENKVAMTAWFFYVRYEKQGWKIEFPTKERFNSPQEAYSAAFDYVLNKVI